MQVLTAPQHVAKLGKAAAFPSQVKRWPNQVGWVARCVRGSSRIVFVRHTLCFGSDGVLGRDVLVDPEDVVGVILPLDFHQSVVVVAIIGSDSCSVVVVHEVDITSDL